MPRDRAEDAVVAPKSGAVVEEQTRVAAALDRDVELQKKVRGNVRGRSADNQEQRQEECEEGAGGRGGS